MKKFFVLLASILILCGCGKTSDVNVKDDFIKNIENQIIIMI